LTHHTHPDFWACYKRLQPQDQRLADRAFKLLKKDPRHPSIKLKKVGVFWSASVGIHHRALAAEAPDGLVWFWIGTHAEYDKQLG
jgi:hypothetical protein